MANFIAALLAIIKLPSVLLALSEKVEEVGNRISLGLDALRIGQLEKELAQYKAEVNQTLKRIENAKTNEERLKLSSELANRLR